MYGLTRATITLIAAGVAGLLIWIATQIDEDSVGGYWAVYGIIAGAGLVMALSQLLGGWTKWGWPRVSVNVFLWAFVPVLIVAGWIVAFGEPDTGWLGDHVRGWSDDIGIDGLVKDLREYVGALAFGIGLVFGFTFDTAGPAAEAPWRRGRAAAAAPPPPGRREPPPSAERAGAPGAPPREGPPES